MGNIIITFPVSKSKTAAKIKDILFRSGFQDVLIVGTGSEALQEMDRRTGGIVITPVRLPDMYYTELREYLPDSYEILLLDSGSNISAGRESDVMAVTMPVKVREFVDTVRMMMDASDRKAQKKARIRKKSRSTRDENYIKNAKYILMDRNHMTEDEAYRYLQKTSMDTGRSMLETAQMIIMMAIS